MIKVCIKCTNEADIEGQDVCGDCATEELFNLEMKAKSETVGD